MCIIWNICFCLIYMYYFKEYNLFPVMPGYVHVVFVLCDTGICNTCILCLCIHVHVDIQ